MCDANSRSPVGEDALRVVSCFSLVGWRNDDVQFTDIVCGFDSVSQAASFVPGRTSGCAQLWQ